MIGRVTDQTMMLHGLKDVNTRDVLKLHGFNKDKPGLREFVYTGNIDYIYHFSDETFIIVDYTNKTMYLSYYDKVVNITFTYANCFRFYEQNGQKYIIAYISGQAYWGWNGGSSYWYMEYIKDPDITFRIYDLNYGATNPSITTSVSSRRITSVPAAWKVGGWLNRNPYNDGTIRPNTFDYDPSQDLIVFADTRSGYGGFSDSSKYEARSMIWTQNLQTGAFKSAVSLQRSGGSSKSDASKHRTNVIRHVGYTGRFYCWGWCSGGTTVLQIILSSDGSISTTTGLTNSKLMTVQGNKGWMSGTQGPSVFNMLQGNDGISVTERSSTLRYSSNTSGDQYFANMAPDFGGLCSIYNTTQDYHIPRQRVPTYSKNVYQLDNPVSLPNMSYKYYNTLFGGNLCNTILQWSSEKKGNNVIVVHSPINKSNYEMDVEIHNDRFSNTTAYQRVIFKSEDGNIVPHFTEYRQPYNTKLFVLKVNLVSGWNYFTFEETSELTNFIDNGYNVFKNFVNFRNGIPSTWTVPVTTSSVNYMTNNTGGLYGGRIGGQELLAINTNKKPEYGTRYEIGFSNNNISYPTGYYQFGQMTGSWMNSPTTVYNNLDCVTAQPYSYDASKTRDSYNYRHATCSIDGNVALGRMRLGGSPTYYPQTDSIAGFEYGRNRRQVYGYATQGQGAVITGVAYDNVSDLNRGKLQYGNIPGEQMSYGHVRTPNTSQPIQLFLIHHNTYGGTQVLYYRERSPWIGETKSIGSQNTYLVRQGSKIYLDVPF